MCISLTHTASPQIVNNSSLYSVLCCISGSCPGFVTKWLQFYTVNSVCSLGLDSLGMNCWCNWESCTCVHCVLWTSSIWTSRKCLFFFSGGRRTSIISSFCQECDLLIAHSWTFPARSLMSVFKTWIKYELNGLEEKKKIKYCITIQEFM